MDREKVVKDNAIRGLQSAIEISGALVHLRKEHAKAILALLKEQEAKKVNISQAYRGMKYGLCPQCGKQIDTLMNPNYCGCCGQEVKWE